MQFGYGLITAQNPPDSDRDHADVYDEALRLAQLAEANGFDTVWTSEHHFFDDGYSPSVLPFSAALAAATDTIGIGTSVALAPLYDPIRLAEDAATVDLLAGGRFRLGLANGYMPREFDVFEVPLAERAERVEDAIGICRGAWTDGPFSYDGHHVSVDDLRVEPTPAQPGGPPILLGGTSRPAVERAARLADGHIGVVYNDEAEIYDASMAEFAENAAYLADASETDGSFSLLLMQYAHVAETTEEAWTALAPALRYSRRKYAEHDEGDASKWVDVDDAVLESSAVFGDPETVVERLAAYDRRVPGELHFLARLWHPTFSFEEHADAIRLFGEAVIPELRD